MTDRDDELTPAESTVAGAILLTRWGHDGPRKVAQIKARWNRVRNGLDDDGKRWLDRYIDQFMQPTEVAAVLDVLAA